MWAARASHCSCRGRGSTASQLFWTKPACSRSLAAVLNGSERENQAIRTVCKLRVCLFGVNKSSDMILMEDFMNANASDVHVSCCLWWKLGSAFVGRAAPSSAGLDPFTTAGAKNSALGALPHSCRIHLNEFRLYTRLFATSQNENCERRTSFACMCQCEFVSEIGATLVDDRKTTCRFVVCFPGSFLSAATSQLWLRSAEWAKEY